MSALSRLDERVTHRVVRCLGKFLGEKLYYGFVRGLLHRRELREILTFPLKEPELVAGLYFGLVRSVGRVSLPRRF